MDRRSEKKSQSEACAAIELSASAKTRVGHFIKVSVSEIFRRRDIRRWQLFLAARFRAIRALALIKLRTEVRIVLPLLAQAIKVKLGQGHPRTHQNNQLRPVMTVRRATKKRAEDWNTREIRDAGSIFVFAVGNQAPKHNG